MLKRALLVVLAAGLAAPVAQAQIGPDRGKLRKRVVVRDSNQRKSASTVQSEAAARKVFDHVMAQPEIAAAVSQAAGAVGDLCAIGVIPGPIGSFDIRLSLLNVGSSDIGFATIDSFLALGGRALIQSDVFNTTPPAGGTLTVEYPSLGGGVGPAVLSFTGFSPLLGTAFNLDPDTYDDPSFGATVGEMNRTFIEVAFDDGRRCRGGLAFNAGANASVAFLLQTSP
jgi:hypothetical protein